jgi:hypothetical protein
VAGFNKDFISNEWALGKVARHFGTKRLDSIPDTLEDFFLVASLHLLPMIPAVEGVHDQQDIGRQIFEHLKDGYFRSITTGYSDGMPKGVIGILREIRGIKYSVHSLEIGIH